MAVGYRKKGMDLPVTMVTGKHKEKLKRILTITFSRIHGMGRHGR
jgi:hypothetical protein